MSMQCVILAGGYGTRLGHLTATCPKPMLEILNMPFIEHLVWWLFAQGIEDIVILAGYLGGQIKEHFSSTAFCRSNLHVHTIIEDGPMGTAGAILMCRDQLRRMFFMINGDSFFGCDLHALASKKTHGEWVAKMALCSQVDTSRYGRVNVDNRHLVMSFSEKCKVAGPGMVNAGIYWANNDLLGYISSVPASLENDLFPALVRKKLLYAYAFPQELIDIGTPASLADAQNRLPNLLYGAGTNLKRRVG